MRSLVIDGTFLLYRNFHQPRAWDLSAGDLKTGGTYVFLKSLRQALERIPDISKVIVVWDGARSARRQELYPAYKANRDNRHEAQREGETIDLDAEFKRQRAMLESVFPLLGVRVATLPTKEGDDIIYCVSRMAGRAVILSEDKDMFTMIRPTVGLYRPMADEYFTWQTFIDRFGYTPDLFVFNKAIVGDKSDNIDGVRGAGPKTAEKFCSMLQAAQGDDPELRVLMTLAECSEHKDKKLNAIPAQVDVLERNIQLMDCSYEPFSAGELARLRQAISNPAPARNHAQFIAFCDTYQFATLTGEEWFQPFEKLI